MTKSERIVVSIAGLAVLISVARITHPQLLLAGIIGCGYGVIAMRWVRS